MVSSSGILCSQHPVAIKAFPLPSGPPGMLELHECLPRRARGPRLSGMFAVISASVKQAAAAIYVCMSGVTGRCGAVHLQELRECLHRQAGRTWLSGLWAAKSASVRQAGQPEQAALLSALLAGLLKCLQTQEARLSCS